MIHKKVGDAFKIVDGVEDLRKGDIFFFIDESVKDTRPQLHRALSNPKIDRKKNCWRIKTEFVKE